MPTFVKNKKNVGDLAKLTIIRNRNFKVPPPPPGGRGIRILKIVENMCQDFR